MTDSQTIFADLALTPQGWQEHVRLTISLDRISAVEAGATARPGDDRRAVVVPALGNLHSHAFQRAMAGLAERRHAGTDTFWSWRELMYRLALSMTPDQVEAVARQAYVEMLEAGYCAVGEFHYVHHDVSGRPYANIAETAERVLAAGAETGLRVALLPVFYAHSKFGGEPPTEMQRRFINTRDSYARLLDGCRRAAKASSTASVGVAPHSLRAVTPEELDAVTAMAKDAPIHIHIAEQVKEVEDCVAWSGQRPVEWLLAHCDVDRRWCLVHATHMTADEISGVAGSGAVAGLCPITEANLGDGIFDGDTFIAEGGRYGVGTDSNVQIGAAEELRMLEYSQRLARRARNVMTPPDSSTGRTLFESALRGSAQALGHAGAGLAHGAAADIVALNPHHPALLGARKDAILDAWIFAAGGAAVDAVWVAGRQVVNGGRHVKRDAVVRRYAEVMTELAAL
jgi:formiminoglutamate deiminase